MILIVFKKSIYTGYEFFSIGGRNLLLLGTFLSSVMFTLLGMIIAMKITSLNQFILATVLDEIIAFVPAPIKLCVSFLPS